MDFRPAAIVAEYNPFHSGHAYHIERTRNELGASHIIAVMSGNFVQRGECACVSKWTRAHMALLGGADIVVELPVPWAVATAERFASGAVSIAHSLGGVSMLSFGSECGDISALTAAAGVLDCDDRVTGIMHELLELGMGFASARTRAVRAVYGELADIIENPNDTLGVEYIRALRRLGSDIEPVCIRRKGAAHDQTTPGEDTASGSYIRAGLSAGRQPEYIPPQCMKLLVDATISERAPARMALLERAMLLRLRTMSAADIAALPDISEGLENRIYQAVQEKCSVEEIICAVKTKRYSHARIRRILLCALLGIRREHGEGLPPYIRILGMNQPGRELMAHLSPSLPVITRRADLRSLGQKENELFALEQLAGDIFSLATPGVQKCGSDVSNGIVIV